MARGETDSKQRGCRMNCLGKEVGRKRKGADGIVHWSYVEMIVLLRKERLRFVDN